MSKATVFKVLSSTGVPIAHVAWPKGKAPPLPWAVYREDSNMPLEADGVNYVEFPRWEVDLYQKTADETVESSIEEAITREFGPYSKYESWVDSENCLVTVYQFREWSSNG